MHTVGDKRHQGNGKHFPKSITTARRWNRKQGKRKSMLIQTLQATKIQQKNVTDSFMSIIYAPKSVLHTRLLSAACCTKFKSREWGWGHVSSWVPQTVLPSIHSYEVRLCQNKAELKPKLHLPRKDKKSVSQPCLPQDSLSKAALRRKPEENAGLH